MLFLLMLTFCFSSHSHHSHVNIQGIVKFGADCPLEGFSKAIEKTISYIPDSFHLRNSVWVFHLYLIQFSL